MVNRGDGEAATNNVFYNLRVVVHSRSYIKQEVSEDIQDYDKMITPQEIHGRGKKGGHDGKYTSGENIEAIMDAVIEKGIRETSRHGGSAVAYSSDGDADVEMGEQAKPVVVKTEGEKRGRKKGPVAANRKQDSADLFSAPQHFTANAKTPPKKKMSRIPKITEKVTLPSPSSLMSGLQNPAAAAMNPMSNPLIPNFGMNLYGFGNIPANMIPGNTVLPLVNTIKTLLSLVNRHDEPHDESHGYGHVAAGGHRQPSRNQHQQGRGL